MHVAVRKKNNNEGSVKNNHKLYIFAQNRNAVMWQSANPKPLLRQKVVFNLHSFVQSESYALHTSILIHIYFKVHIAIFIDAHMILSHHIIMCKYERSKFFSPSPSSLHLLSFCLCRMVFNALNVAIIIM